MELSANDLWAIGILVGWFVLQVYVLPKFGVST